MEKHKGERLCLSLFLYILIAFYGKFRNFDVSAVGHKQDVAFILDDQADNSAGQFSTSLFSPSERISREPSLST